MNNRHIQFDPRRCIACKACEVHCQVAHQTADDVKMGLLITAEPSREEGKNRSIVQILSAFRTCFHCEEPWCMAVCPTDAIKKEKRMASFMWKPNFASAAKPVSMPAPGGCPNGMKGAEKS